MEKQRILILSVILFCITTTIQAQFLYRESERINLSGNFTSDAIMNNLKGKVETVTVFAYDAAEENGEYWKVKYWNPKRVGKVYNYDRQGNIISYHVIKDSLDFSNREKRKEFVHEYNEKNNPVKIITKDIRSPESLYSNITEHYEYDESGKITSYTQLKKDKSLSYSISYKYDKKSGMISKYKTENPDDKTKYQLEFKETENNRLECSIFKAGRADDILVYNNDGFIVELKEHHSKIISRSPLRTKTYYDKIFYHYNEQGDVIKKQKISGNLLSGSDYMRTYSYVYDQYNNWIKKMSFEDGNIYSIEEREIKYYE